MSIRIAMADDHAMVRKALLSSLSAEPEFEVVAEAGTAGEIITLVAQTQPDVLLLDITLPDRNGIEVTRELHRSHPSVKVIALTGHGERPFIEAMLKAGAQGYVVKSADAIDLVTAIHTVARGRKYLSSEVNEVLLKRFEPGQAVEAPPLSVLSNREREVLRLLVQGNRSHQMANLLGITAETVDVYRRNIRKKTGLRTVAELTRYAIREGLSQV